MREIKFRAWNKENKIMCYDNEDNSEDYWDGVVSSELGLINTYLCIMQDEYELMQYSGLIDEKGVEVFEGDIVELYCIRTYCGRQVSQYDKPTKFRAVIKFGKCPNGFGIGFNFDYNNKFNEKVCEPIGKEQGNREIWKRAIGEFLPNEYKKKITHPNWIWKNHFEVIGNIYENPELLGENNG